MRNRLQRWLPNLFTAVILVLLGLYPVIMKTNFSVVNYSVHSQIGWFFPDKLAYIVLILCIIAVWTTVSYRTAVKFLPYVAAFMIVSGFIIAQIPNLITGDNLLHSANARLIDEYGKIPSFTNTYVSQWPSFFILASLFSYVTGVNLAYSNVLLVALTFIIIIAALVLFLRAVTNDEVVVYLTCTFVIVGNFYLTFFNSIFTLRLFTLPLLYLSFYAICSMRKKPLESGVIFLLSLITIVIGHAVTPLYALIFITSLLIYNVIQRSPIKHTAVIVFTMVAWITYLLHEVGPTLGSLLTILSGEKENPYPAASSSLIQSQLDFSKDLITTFLRIYRVLLISLPFLVGGIVAFFLSLSILKHITSNKNNQIVNTSLGDKSVPISLVAISFTGVSFLLFMVSGRGIDYLMLYAYPIFSFLFISMVLKMRRRIYGQFVRKLVIVILVGLIGVSVISVNSSRIYFSSADFSGLNYLSNFGSNAKISTTGDIFYAYAYFNPTYFWPGKEGSTLLIYTTPDAIVEQAKRVPYVFQGDVAIRSLSQTISLYFSGLSPSFLTEVDKSLALSRNRIFDNSYFIMWS